MKILIIVNINNDHNMTNITNGLRKLMGIGDNNQSIIKDSNEDITLKLNICKKNGPSLFSKNSKVENSIDYASKTNILEQLKDKIASATSENENQNEEQFQIQSFENK